MGIGDGTALCSPYPTIDDSVYWLCGKSVRITRRHDWHRHIVHRRTKIGGTAPFIRTRHIAG